MVVSSRGPGIVIMCPIANAKLTVNKYNVKYLAYKDFHQRIKLIQEFFKKIRK